MLGRKLPGTSISEYQFMVMQRMASGEPLCGIAGFGKSAGTWFPPRPVKGDGTRHVNWRSARALWRRRLIYIAEKQGVTLIYRLTGTGRALLGRLEKIASVGA